MKAIASRFSRPPKTLGIHSPGCARVIEIEHRGDRVHAKAVDVILVDPEERVRQQKILDFVAAVVENQRAPIGMLAEARVGVFVEMRAVEKGEAVRVAREMRGSPIEQHADAFLVALVDEIHEIFGRAVAAGDGEVADGLIAPRGVERMLHDAASVRCACSPCA